MRRTCWSLLSIFLILLLAACGSKAPTQSSSSHGPAVNPLDRNMVQQLPPPLSIVSQQVTPTPPPSSHSSSSSSSSSCVTYSNETTAVPAKDGTLAAPYGSAPVTSEAQQIAQQLLQLINSNRAACGLPPFAWSATLASGALLHSWNMYHCGFSHTCPDGMSQCQRIANEGFAGQSDCGENIGEAGPYPTPWAGVASVQESMANEPVGGWHRIHLFSTTLHLIGIGVYVAPNGYLWFTEDMAS